MCAYTTDVTYIIALCGFSVCGYLHHLLSSHVLNVFNTSNNMSVCAYMSVGLSLMQDKNSTGTCCSKTKISNVEQIKENGKVFLIEGVHSILQGIITWCDCNA